MDELIDIITPQGVNTGKTILKAKAHELGVWHTSVDIWIYNSKGDVLIQKRSADKDTHPNCWDVSVAGHITANEEPLNAAQRELLEELGLMVNKEDFLFVDVFKIEYYHRKDFIDREFHYVYVLQIDVLFNELRLQEEEVSEVKWIPVKNLSVFSDSSNNNVIYPKKYMEAISRRMI